MCELEEHGEKGFVPPAYTRDPLWKRQVERAMRELDPDSLLASVHAAEDALFQRWQVLGDRARGNGEGMAMAAAAEELLAIKIHKLKWPDYRVAL